MVFSRVCSAMFATPTTESVSAGSARWCNASASVTSAADTPMGTEKPNGNQPSHTENTMRNTSPSQNVGTDASRKQ